MTAIENAIPDAPEPVTLDNRGLEPPRPLIRILEALQDLAARQELVSLLDREPLLLYPQLENRGFRSETSVQADGSYVVRIWRDA